ETSTELCANRHAETAGSTSDRHDRKSGEEEHHACADDDTDEDIGVVQREREQFVVSELLLHGGTEGTEQRGRGQDRGGDRDALGDRLGGVAGGGARVADG